MMLLGIYLHVVVGYSGDGSWPYIDQNPTAVLNWSLGLIHAFRMPAFFAMAGFFAALLWHRRGPLNFLKNRAQRILLPFALFWTLLFPVTAYVVLSKEQGSESVVAVFFSARMLPRLHPLHLWFLEYLVFLCIITAAVAYCVRRQEWVHRGFAKIAGTVQAPLIFAAVSYVPLRAMRGNLQDVEGFAPNWWLLAAYLVPFTFGWLLYGERSKLQVLRKRWAFYSVMAALAAAAFLLAHSPVTNVLLCWTWIYASLAVFLRFCGDPSPSGRYLSDSSYWLYIMHLPVVVGLQVAFTAVPWPALAKIPIVLALAVGILLLTYDWFVRPTWIGALLNGRRYPRGLPRMEPARRYVAA